MKALVRRITRSLGYDIVRYPPPVVFPPDVSTNDAEILQCIAPFTMASLPRQIALIQAVRFLVRRSIPGCLVECGVWRGGCSMAMALTLAQEGDTSRDVYLYDTFAGMPTPTDADKMHDGSLAATQMAKRVAANIIEPWCYASLDDVRSNMTATRYPEHRVHCVSGLVESTLPSEAPTERIALLRLDTDFYHSTKHELDQLFPRLQPGGILMVDDYGHWEGAKRAVDEYFEAEPYYLHRIDYSGRSIVKRGST